MGRSTVPAGSAAVARDEIADEYEGLVARTSQQLLEAVDQGGTPVTEIVAKVTRTAGTPASVVREALSTLLYRGELALTGDRRIVRS
jgi:hypothetical protein